MNPDLLAPGADMHPITGKEAILGRDKFEALKDGYYSVRRNMDFIAGPL